MEFKDMKEVYPKVSDQMVAKAQRWLLGRRNAKGGFAHSRKTFYTVGAKETLAKDLYVLYGLTESGYLAVEKEVAANYEAAMTSGSPYLIALAANIQYNMGQTALAQQALSKLVNTKRGQAHLTSNRSAIGGSGMSKDISTTALTMMAMLKDANPDRAALAEMAQALRKSRNANGYFGSTHSTVLAMRALVAYLEVSSEQSVSGSIHIQTPSLLPANFDWKANETPAFDLTAMTHGLTADRHDFPFLERT